MTHRTVRSDATRHYTVRRDTMRRDTTVHDGHARAMRALMTTATMLVVLTAAASLSGCASTAHTGPYQPLDPRARDPELARELNRQAAELLAADPTKAEALLRRALEADLYNGPAHNNLGVSYLSRGMLYEAAGEFEWARRLMPGHPDPRVNLGLALERGGKIDEAIDAYLAATEVMPGHLPAMQALARAQIRHGYADDQTAELLAEIGFRGDNRWRRWARLERAKLLDPSTRR